jgi:hypothetical protein
MKNDESQPMISEPELFRRAFGAKARDPGEVTDKVRAEEQAREQDVLDDIEVFGRFDRVLILPPLLYVSNLPPLSWVWGLFLPG